MRQGALSKKSVVRPPIDTRLKRQSSGRVSAPAPKQRGGSLEAPAAAGRDRELQEAAQAPFLGTGHVGWHALY
jgi:hypothetical protein